MRLLQCCRLAAKLVIVIVVAVCFVQADEELGGDSEQTVSRVRRQTATLSAASERGSIFNRTLRIVTVHQEPYTAVVQAQNSSDKFNYTGFIPDLIEALARRLYFTYEFYHVQGYGRFDADTKRWTGMIGEVILNDESGGTQGADIAAAALTITSGRERVVNFLKPFQHLGIAAVTRRSPAGDEKPFTFGVFQPLEPSLWGLILLSMCAVAVFLWVMNLFNPYEWASRRNLGQADNQLAELFSLPGSIWFAFTSLQWQGFERAPRSIASKFLGCVWFAFVTITIVTYTAGLINNLYWASMVHRSVSTRHRYIDLAHAVSSGDFSYGTVKNGQTYRFIMEVAVGEEFEAIRRYWRSPEGQVQLVATFDEGLNRARDPNSNYVFLMESLPAKYYVNRRPCDLTVIGEPFGSRSYGFAVPMGMPFGWSDELHRGILELTEEGDIEDLERRWFIDVSQCWNVTLQERLASDLSVTLNVDRPRSVDVATFAGPLVMITVGLLLSVGIAIAEILFYRKFGQVHDRHTSQMSQEKNAASATCEFLARIETDAQSMELKADGRSSFHPTNQI